MYGAMLMKSTHEILVECKTPTAESPSRRRVSSNCIQPNMGQDQSRGRACCEYRDSGARGSARLTMTIQVVELVVYQLRNKMRIYVCMYVCLPNLHMHLRTTGPMVRKFPCGTSRVIP